MPAIRLFRDPAQSSITINLTGFGRDDEIELSIIDLKGSTVYSNNVGAESHGIAISSFAHGVYLLTAKVHSNIRTSAIFYNFVYRLMRQFQSGIAGHSGPMVVIVSQIM